MTTVRPKAVRKTRVNYAAERSVARRTWLRLTHDSQFLRSAVQAAFALLCAWIGVEFYLFVRSASAVAGPLSSRPPGVEGFLPISALITASYWLRTGVISHIHPAGLFIFLAIIAVSVVCKKAFCSWLCPVGTLSEYLWKLGKKVFKRNLQPPAWLDYPLRSLKYLLLLFFLWVILQMNVQDLGAFINSPYNRVADVKMYLFFAHISTFALRTILVLAILSVFVRNAWCRYLCPYGALLGMFSFLSPLKVTRNASSCIDCSLCTRACPSAIKVEKANRVWSDECMGCLACVQVCPVKDTLDVKTGSRAARPVPNWLFALLVVGLFAAFTFAAMLTGHWHNNISADEYRRRIHEIDSPIYQHFEGKVPRDIETNQQETP